MKNLFKKIIAIGLVATMTLGMAVTSFAEETGADDTTITEEAGGEAGADGDEGAGDEEGEEDKEEPVEAPVITFGSDKTDLAGTALEDTYLWTSGSKKGTILDEDDKEADFDYTTLALNVAATAPEGGKVIVGTSATSVKTAPVTGGKFAKDTSGMAKASLKGNVLTLKPDKAAGDVRVWVAIIGKDKAVKASSYVDVTVKAGASKITFSETVEVDGEEENKTIKAAVLAVGEEGTYNIEALGKDKKATTDSSYAVTIDSKFSDNITAEVDDGKLVVNAVSLDKDGDAYVAKVVKAKVTVTCRETAKKASFTVSVTNPAESIAPAYGAVEEGDPIKALLYEKDEATVAINAVTAAGEGIATTDKIKIYVAAPVEAEEDEEAKDAVTLSEDGKKVVFTKGKAVTAKLAKDGSTITITRKEAFEAAEIWVSYTDAADKSIELFKVCNIKAVVPTEGDIVLAEYKADEKPSEEDETPEVTEPEEE